MKRWNEILRRAGMALSGQPVILWESDDAGRLHAIASNHENEVRGAASPELEAELRRCYGNRPPGARWVASRLRTRRWCAVPVRNAPWQPPPGVERRSAERMTLELAGLCIGLLGGAQPAIAGDSSVLHTLGRSQRLAARIANEVPGVLWTTDAELRITSRSGAGARAFDVLPEQVVGVSLYDLYEMQSASAESVNAHRRALGGESLAYTIRRGDTWFDAYVEPLRTDSGAITGVIGMAVDVSDRERALDEARRSRQDLQDFFDNVALGVHWAAADGTILRANQAELDMLGYTREKYVGRNIAEFHVDPEVAAEFFRRVCAGETVQDTEVRLRHKDGSTRDVILNCNARFDEGRFVHTRCVSRDVTERKHAERRLVHGAMHDALTDLPNRTYFLERVAQAMERSRLDPDFRFAILYLDCDQFKVINDSLGHAAGERLLKGMAERLRASVRPSDLVARFGGDEFTLLLEGVATLPDVEDAARRIQECFGLPFMLDDRKVFVTASIGVALSATTTGGPGDLVRAADIAMYRAKAFGRGRFQIFNSGMLRRARARFGTEAGLRSAIDRGEFRLLYQPIIEMSTGRVHAFEALLRWHHPERGVIQPLAFIPVAEETGLIVPIGQWVLREACAQAGRWRELLAVGNPVRISVNLSARQLGDRHIVQEVRRALSDAGIEPQRLRMEITETVLMDSVETSVARLRQISQLGVALHVDDFGTGYSSLSLLPRVPLQSIKIDRSFVRRLGMRRSDQELVGSILDMVKRLGMTTIAEGVETAGQCQRLISLGCSLAQGFYFAKPLDSEAAGALLERHGTSR